MGNRVKKYLAGISLLSLAVVAAIMVSCSSASRGSSSAVPKAPIFERTETPADTLVREVEVVMQDSVRTVSSELSEPVELSELAVASELTPDPTPDPALDTLEVMRDSVTVESEEPSLLDVIEDPDIETLNVLV